MAVETLEDLEGFVSDWDEATYKGNTVAGVFDNDYRETEDIAGSYPVFTCLASRVSDIERGSLITIENTTYKVAKKEPDGHGMVTLRLKTNY